jgi:hypothetical protein
MRRDIDDALDGWSYDPRPGEVLVREVKARDGRTVLQVRVELGVLQLEREGRPDGSRPQGFGTYLDYLRHRADRASRAGGTWAMSPEHCLEADREFAQFYHRRVAFLALRQYDRAVKDAEHTLELMDFVARHGDPEEYITSHERLRGLVQFHRTEALVALALERRRPDEALDCLLGGIEQLRRHRTAWSEEHDADDLPDGTLIEQLESQEREIRRNFGVGKTLGEQLQEAIAHEDYERAARLRDQIQARRRK